jgi:hypothetical protein
VEDLLSFCFALPFSIEAYQEFQQINQLLVNTPLARDRVDQRVFVWGEKYTPASYYKLGRVGVACRALRRASSFKHISFSDL